MITDGAKEINDIVADDRVTWGISAVHVDSNEILLDWNTTAVMKTASVPKLFLLWRISEMIEQGEIDSVDLVAREDRHIVGGSGIWNQLSANKISINDAATLVAAFSDNVATNVLLDVAGLSSVQKASQELNCKSTRLNDYIRSVRDPEVHPSSVSHGTAGELSRIGERFETMATMGHPIATRVVNWLRSGIDLSMVPRNFGIDPSSYSASEEGVSVWNKTGTDDGVRADTGVIAGKNGRVAYSVIANWTDDSVSNRQVLESMGKIGLHIRNLIL